MSRLPGSRLYPHRPPQSGPVWNPLVFLWQNQLLINISNYFCQLHLEATVISIYWCPDCLASSKFYEACISRVAVCIGWTVVMVMRLCTWQLTTGWRTERCSTKYSQAQHWALTEQDGHHVDIVHRQHTGGNEVLPFDGSQHYLQK